MNLVASPKAPPSPKPLVFWENRQGWLLANYHYSGSLLLSRTSPLIQFNPTQYD